MQVKLAHWDPSIRSLSAVALGRMATLDRPFAEGVLVPYLVGVIQRHRDVELTEGALLALGRVLFALSWKGTEWTDLVGAASNSEKLPHGSLARFCAVDHPVLHAQLIKWPQTASRTLALPADTLQTIANLPIGLPLYNTGVLSELVRTAAAVFSGHVALAQLPIHHDSYKTPFIFFITSYCFVANLWTRSWGCCGHICTSTRSRASSQTSRW